MATFTATQSQTNTRTSIRPLVRFDIEYMKSFHGMLKIVLLVLGIINLIIIIVAPIFVGASRFFSTTIGLAWWYTLVMLLLFLFHIPEKFYTLPWLPVEIGALCIVSLLYFIASLLVILQRDTTHTVAGIFGFLTTGVYAYSGYLKFNAWKSGALAQGTITRTNTTTSTFQATAYPA